MRDGQACSGKVESERNGRGAFLTNNTTLCIVLTIVIIVSLSCGAMCSVKGIESESKTG